MALDLSRMLEKIEEGQWSLDDVDWQAPGAETVRPEQREKLRAFLTDLVWIEHVGARGFAALARQAHEPTLQAIYGHFEREEERHARAELALMRRWGLIGPGEIPVANINIRLVVAWLDRFASVTDFATLTCTIAMLEVALDGALVKFLLDEVEDPVCHEVFALINRDESRHLAVDFHVMEMIGARSAASPRTLARFVRRGLDPRRVAGMLAYVPLLNAMRDNLVELGFDEARLFDAIRRFDTASQRSPMIARSPAYRAIRAHGRMVVDRTHPYHLFADALVALTQRIPPRALGPLPPWAQRLAA
jgi:hypothetical protein